MRPTCNKNYADLIRAFAAVPRESRLQVADFCGFRPCEKRGANTLSPTEARAKSSFNKELKAATDELQFSHASQIQKDQRQKKIKDDSPSFSLWMPVEFEYREPNQAAASEHWLHTLTPITDSEWSAPKEHQKLPKKTPLMPWTRLWPFLHRALSRSHTGLRVDIVPLVTSMAQLKMPSKVPRRSVRAWSDDAWIIVDNRPALFPFFDDMAELLSQLKPLRGKKCVSAIVVRDGYPPTQIPPEGTPVLVIGDMGMYEKEPQRIGAWVKYGKRLKKRGCENWVLAPCPRDRWAFEIANAWSMAFWDERAAPPVSPAGLRPLSDSGLSDESHGMSQLMGLMAPALRVEPSLLRALRLLLPPEHRNVKLEYWAFNTPRLARGLDAIAVPTAQTEAAGAYPAGRAA